MEGFIAPGPCRGTSDHGQAHDWCQRCEPPEQVGPFSRCKFPNYFWVSRHCVEETSLFLCELILLKKCTGVFYVIKGFAQGAGLFYVNLT